MKKWFQRCQITLSSRVDHVLNRVENHEAVVAAAIGEAREHAARARVKLNRVRRDGEQLRQRAAQLGSDARRWEERAVATAQSDRDAARECLRRKRLAGEEKVRLEAEATAHATTERQLAEDIRRVEERVRELQRRRHTLSARAERAEATLAAAPDEDGLLSGIEDVFERWEGRLTAQEIHAELPLDHFAEGYERAEDQAALDAELDALLARGGDQPEA